jgi:serine protease AprX
MCWSTPVHSVRAVTLVVLFAVAVLAAPAPAASRPPTQPTPRATHVVQVRPEVSLSEGGAIVRAAGGRVARRLPIIHGLAVSLPAGAGSALLRHPAVSGITANASVRSSSTSLDGENPAVPVGEEPAATSDGEVPMAPESGGPRTAYPYSVLAPQAWASATGAGVGVAVIDTGIDGTHPDFLDRDGASRVVASVVTNPDATTAGDSYGHGSHVAGIIAGDGRNRSASDPVAGRYVGIAPEADLISVKVGNDDGNATILDVIYGLQFVVDHKDAYNIRVVNLSLESTVAQSYRQDPLDAAVESAHFHGILVVAAAGNHGATPEAANFAPGNDPFALTVGAVDDHATADRSDDAYTEWSSVGLTQDGFSKPEIAAPGSQIVSTLAGGSEFTRLCPSCIVDDEYIRAGGTSMAAPVVSGVAALVIQRHPEWTPDEVKRTLVATARNLEGGVEEVNASAAVAAETPSPGTSAGIVPNDLVDASSGDIDYTRSSWSRSSWSTAPESLIASWARSSWSCACFGSESEAIDPTRSSWSRSSWSRSSWSTKWSY